MTLRPRDLATLAGVHDALDVRIEETDLSSIVAVADKVLRVSTAQGQWLVHFEFQSGYDKDLIGRAFWYNAAIYRRHKLPVNTVLVLLTKKVDSPRITGTHEVKTPTGRVCLIFQYDVIRLWETSVESLLKGPVGLLPLAPLCKGAEDVKAIIARMDRRIHAEASPQEQGKLWLATYSLLGLRFDADTALDLIPKGKAMKESTTYQAILEEGRKKGEQEGRQEGRQEEAIHLLLRVGERTLGQPGAGVRNQLKAISDLDIIEQMIERLGEVRSWQELLSTGSSVARPAQRKKHKS